MSFISVIFMLFFRNLNESLVIMALVGWFNSLGSVNDLFRLFHNKLWSTSDICAL